MRNLDRTDRAIVNHLQKDARVSNKDLAASIGIAASTCSERVHRLRTEGTLTGFHATVNPAVLGIGMRAMIAVRLRRHAADEVDSFVARSLEVPEVMAVSHVTGANDFIVQLVVRDADHLREIVVTGFTGMPEVAHIETSLVFAHVAKAELPDLT